jgi:ribonuclease T1
MAPSAKPNASTKWQAIAGAVIVAVASMLIWYWQQGESASQPPVAPTTTPVTSKRPTQPSQPTKTTAPPPQKIESPRVDDKTTLQLQSVRDPQEVTAVTQVAAQIDAGGPFRYRKDGTTWENRERRLAKQPPGYYREYTVDTPGESDRGARRIIAGGRGEMYYTRDHYGSFVQIRPPQRARK